MRRALRALVASVLLSICALASPVGAEWLSDQVPDGPAAEIIRQSLDQLEEGEAASNEAARLEHYQRGLALAKRAVEIDRDSANAHFAYFANWGRILQMDGWFKNAFHLPALLDHLDRTLELDPDHPDALASRAGLYLQLPGFLGGDDDKGEPMLRRAIALDPDMAGGRLELARHCMETDREEEAAKLATQALRIARGNGKHWHEERALSMLDDLGVPPPPIQASTSQSGITAAP